MKPFKEAYVRDLLNQVTTEKITFSRFVEILNNTKTKNMAQIKNLLSDLKQAEESFNNGLLKLSNDFEKQQEKENERVTLGNGELDAQSSDFGLFYCLSESLIQTERCISEKPSRELALVKTKLQEAIFWAKQSNH